MNRKFLNLILLVLPLAACTPDNGQEQIDAQAPYTLSVDKTEIESDGKQAATFTIVDANGKVLTDDNALMSKIYFKNEATDKRLARRTRTFRSVEDGEYTFSATVAGDPCENTVTISSVNRSTYEVFRKNVCIYRFTATWCPNCPSMTQGLERVSDWTKSRFVELDLHGAGSTYALSDGSKVIADYLCGKFNAPGFPSCVYDLDYMSEERTYTEIESIIFDRIAQHPTTCGIKAQCDYNDGTLSLQAWLKTSAAGKYDLGYAMLKDDCPGGADAYEEEYDNVVTVLSANYEYFTPGAQQLESGEEYKFVDISSAMNQPLTGDLSKYSMVVFALKQKGSKVVIDNVVRMPLIDGSVDYIYN